MERNRKEKQRPKKIGMDITRTGYVQKGGPFRLELDTDTNGGVLIYKEETIVVTLKEISKNEETGVMEPKVEFSTKKGLSPAVIEGVTRELMNARIRPEVHSAPAGRERNNRPDRRPDQRPAKPRVEAPKMEIQRLVCKDGRLQPIENR